MMRSIFVRIVKGAASGIAIGCLIELLFSALFAGNSYVPGVPGFLASFANMNVAVLVERVLYALIGVAGVMASSLFDNEKRPLIVSTSIHCIVIAITVCSVGVVLGWVRNWTGVISMLAIFLAVYALIWVCIYLTERNIAKKMTRQINEREEIIQKPQSN